MNIDRERLLFLLQAYVNETISEKELDELTGLVGGAGADEDLQAVIDEVWKELDMQKQLMIRSDTMYLNIIRDRRVIADRPLRKVRSSGRLTWTVAAAIILLCTTAAIWWFDVRRDHGAVRPLAGIAVDTGAILPGGKKALLTLADGRSINLDDIKSGRIAEEAGVLISKTADGQIVYRIAGEEAPEEGSFHYNTISTPRGGEYQLVLPDGTRVWLNAASTLRYPAQFAGAERRVELEGEAYFEVSRREDLPFIVNTAMQEVEVLGTHFNVRAYGDEPAVKTTLIEGKVKVHQALAEAVTLRPGQQASSRQGGGRIDVNTIDIEEATAWKDGYFYFQNEDIRSVMNSIARWYNIEVEYQGDMEGKVFGGTISRFESFEKLLQTIALTGSVRFRIEGRRIIVMA